MYESYGVGLSQVDMLNYLWGNVVDPKAKEYRVVSQQENNFIVKSDVVEHLKLDDANLESDDYYNLLISAAIFTAEYITRRELIRKQFKFYCPYLRDGMQIRRGQVITIDSIKYLDQNDSWTTLDAASYYMNNDFYPKLYAKQNTPWPSMVSYNVQPVEVKFTAGCTDEELEFMLDLKLGILHHISVLH